MFYCKHSTTHDKNGVPMLVGAKTITRGIRGFGRITTRDDTTFAELFDSAGEFWIAKKQGDDWVSTAHTHLANI